MIPSKVVVKQSILPLKAPCVTYTTSICLVLDDAAAAKHNVISRMAFLGDGGGGGKWIASLIDAESSLTD